MIKQLLKLKSQNDFSVKFRESKKVFLFATASSSFGDMRDTMKTNSRSTFAPMAFTKERKNIRFNESYSFSSSSLSQQAFHTYSGFQQSSSSRSQETASDNNETNFKMEISNGILRLVYNRPEKKNAVTMDMLLNLMKGLQLGNADDNIKVIVITGTGDYFTSGMDLGFSQKPKRPEQESYEKPKETDQKKNSKGFMFKKFLSVILDCKKPIIALVNGHGVGGFGVTMLGLCDGVYASDKATFHTTFTKFQLPPEFGSTYTFPRIMGYGKANNTLLFNQKMNAQEALKCGFVSRVIEHDKFEEETSKLIKSYGELPLKSLIYSKDLVKGDKFKEWIHKVSEHEQSFFDPNVAKQIKLEFMAKSKNKS